MKRHPNQAPTKSPAQNRNQAWMTYHIPLSYRLKNFWRFSSPRQSKLQASAQYPCDAQQRRASEVGRGSNMWRNFLAWSQGDWAKDWWQFRMVWIWLDGLLFGRRGLWLYKRWNDANCKDAKKEKGVQTVQTFFCHRSPASTSARGCEA